MIVVASFRHQERQLRSLTRLRTRSPNMVFNLLALAAVAIVHSSVAAAVNDVNVPNLIPENKQEYCENESFSASCPEGYAILITWGVYGRMQKGKCLANYHTGCSADVRPHLDRSCSGRRTCNIPVSSLINDGTMPCPIDLRSYLEAAYTCVQVLYGHNDACNAKSKTQTISASGYISSHVTTETGCGSVDKPWQLKVGSGQRINITLFDFSFATSGRNSAGDQTHVCTVYAIVKETVSGGQTRTVCGGKYREANVYLSLTNSLEIRVIGKRQKDDDDNVSFMLRYEVVGCEDPNLPEGAWVKRDDTQAMIGCRSAGEQWHLKCNGSQWIGPEVGLCGQDIKSVTGVFAQQSTSDLFKGLSVIIIAIVASSVGLCILFAGLIYLKRQRRLHHTFGKHKNIRYSTDGAVDQQQLQQQQQQQQQKSAGFSCGTGHEEYLSNEWQYPDRMLIRDGTGNQSLSGYGGSESILSSSTRYHEHLYESPKFERRDFVAPIVVPCRGGGGETATLSHVPVGKYSDHDGASVLINTCSNSPEYSTR